MQKAKAQINLIVLWIANNVLISTSPQDAQRDYNRQIMLVSQLYRFSHLSARLSVILQNGTSLRKSKSDKLWMKAISFDEYISLRILWDKRVQKQKGPTMKKNHMLRNILLSTVFALLTIVLMTPIASAHTAAPAHGAATSQVPASVPNVNIVTRHGKAVFSPTVVHCNAHDLTNPCFTLTNTTNAPQQLVFHGHNSLILGPGVYMTFGFGQGVFSLGLKSNPQAVLTVIAS